MPEALDPVFAALVDASRRGLFELLCRHGAHTVPMLAERSGLSKAWVMKHLRILRQAGLVEDRTMGPYQLHAAVPSGLAGMMGWAARVEEAFLHQPEAVVEPVPAKAPRRAAPKAERAARVEEPRVRHVVVERRMPFPVDAVWRALTEPASIRVWLMGNDGFVPAPGCRFTLLGEDGPIDCEVLMAVPRETLSFRWRAHGADTVATLSVRAVGRQRTRLRLAHAGFRGRDHGPLQAAQRGWPLYLANLEALLAGM